jgi:hypothetical protein
MQVRQVEVKNLNHERRLVEVRSDVDDIIQVRISDSVLTYADVS